jgi:EAL domain-containing protein (putative c-di-GMP-specific phosphodiesterase class I)
VKSVVALAGALGQSLVAEGVETVEEYQAVRGCGIRLMQGYLFAEPGFERLPEVNWPEAERSRLFVPEAAA